MNRAQRAPFLALLPAVKEAYAKGIGDTDKLCALCSYCEREWSEMDGRSYLYCAHPVDAVSQTYWKYPDAQTGDCWGFRPLGKIDECQRFLAGEGWDWERAMAEDIAAGRLR